MMDHNEAQQFQYYGPGLEQQHQGVSQQQQQQQQQHQSHQHHQQQHSPHQTQLNTFNQSGHQVTVNGFQSQNSFGSSNGSYEYQGSPQGQASSSFGPNRDNGMTRPQTTQHSRNLSGSVTSAPAPTHLAQSGPRGNQPYARHQTNQVVEATSLAGPAHPVKASSTTSEFTKRKNWSQHIIDEIQDFMHVLTPAGKVLVASQSIRDLAGWSPDELIGQPLDGLIHPDDLPSYRQSFDHALNSSEPLTIYYRFKTKDEQYILLETTGHAHVPSTDTALVSGVAGQPHSDGSGNGAGGGGIKCFFGMSRPYPSKNQAMLDSFLELKFENERLRQELQVMYREIENTSGQADFDGRNYSMGANADGSPLDPATNAGAGTTTVINPATGLIQSNTLLPSSSSTYGALGIGISSSSGKGGPDSEKKKKKPKVEEGEFVCRDCGTVDSPEWRKGPDGPKSLCNACGLRYAKVRSKENKAAKAANEAAKN